MIERRVQRIRRQTFARRPLPLLVSAEEVRREGIADLDRLTPPARQAANEELLKLLGLIPASSSLRAIEGSVLGEQVAGFYDPRSKRLALVRDTGAGDEATAEITLAHELTHALDDQHFGIREQGQTADDRGSAYTALVEGDATAVMTRYAIQYMTGTNLLGVLLSPSSGAKGPPLPPYIEASLDFPYVAGDRFIQSLYRYARGWKLVNYAFRFRPPVSTAQILHPLLYVHNRRPLPTPLRVRPLLGRDWRRTDAGTLGEFDTRQLLQHGMDTAQAERVAAGWRGGRYELWRSGAPVGRACPAPCRPRDALVLAWRTVPGRDAQALVNGLGAYLTSGLGGRARGQGAWALPGGAAALVSSVGTTVLAMAPSVTLAETLALRASPAPG